MCHADTFAVVRVHVLLLLQQQELQIHQFPLPHVVLLLSAQTEVKNQGFSLHTFPESAAVADLMTVRLLSSSAA